MNQGLSFGDGFKFGCGFYVAGIVAGIIMAIGIGILSLILGLLGMSAAMLPFLQQM